MCCSDPLGSGDIPGDPVFNGGAASGAMMGRLSCLDQWFHGQVWPLPLVQGDK